MQSQILQIPSGFVNNVNDPVAGMSAPLSVIGGSLYNGQIGKWADWDDSTVRADSSVAWAAPAYYGGRFQYVQLSEDAGASIPANTLVFWDYAADPGTFTVTDVEDEGSVDNAIQIAGITLTDDVTPGNFTMIQTVGLVYVRFRAALTSAGQKGSPVYATGAGAGADNGTADVLGGANPVQFGDVTLMQRRFLGTAFEAPTNGGLTRVYLGFTRVRD